MDWRHVTSLEQRATRITFESTSNIDEYVPPSRSRYRDGTVTVPAPLRNEIKCQPNISQTADVGSHTDRHKPAGMHAVLFPHN